MATKGDLTFTITIDAKDVAKQIKALEKTDQSVKKADRSSKKYNKTQEEQYTRQKQGVIQTANSTKNFSKMQQQVDGGGGAGGLVRAYALLAANVFALTAAFGVLSRSAQIDTLIQSMEILSTTGGTNIEVLSRQMQKASGYAVDLAQSFRQVSLASSAGLSTQEIEGLTTVAKGAAISLGRDLPDAMDRIFRGAIKLEPEILDEIGLFVRVDEAAERYGRSIGKSASALTQAEKRQGFLNEILEQGTRKFAAYADTIKPDPYVRLGAALADLAQDSLSVLNSVLGPVINFLTDNPTLLAAAFAGLVTFMLTKAIPALGAFNADVAAGAKAALEAETAYQEKIKGTLSLKDSKKMQAVDTDIGAADKGLKTQIKQDKARKDYWVSEAKGQKQNQEDLKRNLGAKKRLQATDERINFLESKKGKLSKKSNALIEKELKARKAEKIELQKHVALLAQKKTLETDIASRATDSSLAARRMAKLESQAAGSAMIAGSVGIAETQGLGAAWKDLRANVKEGKIEIDGVEKSLTKGGKAATLAKGGVQILGVGFQKLMMMMGPIMMAFAILSPLLVMLGKKLGFANDESKRFTEQSKNLEAILENVDKRFESQAQQIGNLSRSYYETSLASIAFLKTQLEISKSMIDMNQKFLEWKRTAKTMPSFWEKLVGDDYEPANAKSPFLVMMKELFDSHKDVNDQMVKSGVASKLFGAALANDTHLIDAYRRAGVDLGQDVSHAIDHIGHAQEKNNKIMSDETFVNSVKDNFTVHQTLNEAYANGVTFMEQLNSKQKDEQKQKQILQGIDVKRLQQLTKNAKSIKDNKEIIDEHNISTEGGITLAAADIVKTEQRIKAQKHMTDAMQGSIETVGKFQSKFMPKTAVDDVLGSFNQLISGFDKLDDRGKKYFEDFDDVTNPISRIFGPDEMRKMLSGDVALEDKKKLFNEVMNEFADAQEVLIAIANKQSKINALQKHYNSLVKAGGKVLELEQKMITKSAELKREQFEVEFELQSRAFANSTTEAGILADRIRNRGKDVSIQEYLNTLTERSLGYGMKEIDAKKLLGLLAKDEQSNLETKLIVGTEQERIDLAQAKYAEKKVLTEQALVKAKQKTLEESRKIANMERGGLTGTLTPQQQAVAKVQAAKVSWEIAKREAVVKKATLDAEKALLDARIDIMAHDYSVRGLDGFDAETMKNNFKASTKAAKDLIDEGVKHAEQAFTSGLLSAVNNAFGSGNLTSAIFGGAVAMQGTDMEEGLSATTVAVQLLQATFTSFGESLAKFGPEGEYAGAFVSGMGTIITSMIGLQTQISAVSELMISGEGEDGKPTFHKGFSESTVAMGEMAAVAGFVAGSIGTIANIMAANSTRQQKEIDKQIEAEKKRDGKSAESVARLKGMEAKKTAIARKAFEQQKKMQMAQTIANTAASIIQVMSMPGDFYKQWK